MIKTADSERRNAEGYFDPTAYHGIQNALASREMHRGEVYYIEKADAEEVDGVKPCRPGIIVSGETINEKCSFVLVVYTTTKNRDDLATHPVVNIKAPSMVLCENVEKVSRERVGGFIKRLAAGEMDRVDNGLRAALGLGLDKVEVCLMGTGAAQEETAPAFELDKKQESHTEIELYGVKVERDTYKALYENLLHEVLAR